MADRPSPRAGPTCWSSTATASWGGARRPGATAAVERAGGALAVSVRGGVERAAAALQHVITLAPANEEIAERLAGQAEALVLMAARFEQSADLARSNAATDG